MWSDWPAIQCIVIGRIPQASDGNVMPLSIFGNTVFSWHGGGGNNTTARIKRMRFFSKTIGWCYANLPTQWCSYVGVCLRYFRRACTSLNYYKEYLFGFETLVFATLLILYMQKDQDGAADGSLCGVVRSCFYVFVSLSCLYLYPCNQFYQRRIAGHSEVHNTRYFTGFRLFWCFAGHCSRRNSGAV